MLSAPFVTTAWRVLRSLMEEVESRYRGSTEKASRPADKGWSSSLGLGRTPDMLRNVTWMDSLEWLKRRKMNIRFGTWNVRCFEIGTKSDTTLRSRHHPFHLPTTKTPLLSFHYFHINVCVSILWPEYAIRAGCYNLTKSGNQWCIQNTALKLTRDSAPQSPAPSLPIRNIYPISFQGFHHH
jgi:hypothetical protein